MAAREVVDNAFDTLCASNGELAAVTGGSWVDIAEYKPAYMDDYKAYRKKKDAVTNAKTMVGLREVKAITTRMRLAAAKTAREAKETAVRIKMAVDLAAEAARVEAERASK